MIIPQPTELINKRKNKKKNEQNVQLSVGVNFINITNRENTRTFYVKSDNVEIMLGSDTFDLINKFLESFFI